MSFAGDLRYHTDLTRQVLTPFLQRPPRHPKVEREGGTKGGKNHFVEFYDNQGEPSPTGILRTTDHWWTVILPHGFLVVDLWALRQWCYPKFERWVDWGGDDRAFAGKLVPLTTLVGLMKVGVTPAERDALHWQTEKLIAAPPPVKPPLQTTLFPTEPDTEEETE